MSFMTLILIVLHHNVNKKNEKEETKGLVLQKHTLMRPGVQEKKISDTKHYIIIYW